MDCRQVLDRLSDYQDGAVDSATAAALADHLRACGGCAAAAGSLSAVRDGLRGLSPDPAPAELLGRILDAVGEESRKAVGEAGTTGGRKPEPYLSRFRGPLEAAAVLLVFASVYWYQRSMTPAVPPPAASASRSPGASAPAAVPPSADVPARNVNPRADQADMRKSPAPTTPRTWSEADLPAVPALRASTDSERIYPAVPPPGTTSKDIPEAVAPASEPGRFAESGAVQDSRPAGVLSAPPSRLFRPLPYGRDIVLNVAAERTSEAKEQVAAAAIRRGGIVERIEPGGGRAGDGNAGTVRVVLPESAADGFLDELGRIGKIPPEGRPSATDLPAGPRAGTVAYAVRIRTP